MLLITLAVQLVHFFTQLLSFIRLLLDFKIRGWWRQNKPLKEVSCFYCCGYLQDLDCSWTNEDPIVSSHCGTACQHASQLMCLKVYYRVNLQHENKEKYCYCSSARASLPCFTSSASLWLLKWLCRWEGGKWKKKLLKCHLCHLDILHRNPLEN